MSTDPESFRQQEAEAAEEAREELEAWDLEDAADFEDDEDRPVGDHEGELSDD